MTLPGPFGLRILSLGDLKDVESTAPSDNDILTWDSASSSWKPEASAAHSHALNDLSDLDAGSPSDDNVLYFDTADSKWKPGSISTLLSSLHLSDLDDVSANVPSEGDILCWDATAGEWYPTPSGEIEELNVDDLADVTITAVADNDILRYDSGTLKWKNEPLVIALNEVSDVDAAAPSDGDFLSFDSASGNWIPVASTAAGRAEGVYPEDYGAVGDGVTDDWTAFNNMFTSLAGMSAETRKKVILNPTVYYRIASRLNSTNVFEIDVDDIIFVGKGMKNLCLQYEGTATTNLFQVGTRRGLAFRDCYIRGDNLDTGVGGVGAKITNIIYGGNLIDFHADYCTFREASGGTFEGFGWNMFWSQVEANSMGFGFKAGLTTTTFTNCYANACTIGYWCFEPFDLAIIGCACDHADAAYVIGGHTASIRGSECENCKQAVVSGGSQHGLTHDGPNLDISGCLFRGRLGTDTQDDTDLAFIDLAYGNYSINAVDCEYIPAMTNAGIGNPLDGNNQYWLRSRLVAEDNHCIVDGSIPKKYICDYFTYNPSAQKRGSPVQVLAKDINYDGDININASALEAALTALSRSELSREVGYVVAEASMATLTPPLRLFDIGGPACGQLEVRMWATTHAVLTVTPVLNYCSIELMNITVPLVFQKIDFTVLAGADTYPLFKIRNCRSVSFLDCKFTSAQAMKIFSFFTNYGGNEGSQLILDKATMDAITGSWNGLSENNRPEQIKFIGYTDKPAAGLFDAGCRIFFDDENSGYIGCICTVGGSPGTWKYFGAVV